MDDSGNVAAIIDMIIPASILKIENMPCTICELSAVHEVKEFETKRIANLCGFPFPDDQADERMPSAPVLPKVVLD